jgi:mannose-6-phosphate isomerase-like protein (cupin superfamily)
MKPYIDEKINEHCWIRTFDPSVTENEEYVWHRDYNDRIVQVLEGSGWKFQFDNELPFDININDKFTIPKMVYHRIKPGKTKLRISINEKF